MKPNHEAKAGRRLAKLFDLDDPKLAPEIDEAAMSSGGYPYEKRLKREEYEEQLGRVQAELLKLQQHLIEAGERVLVLFEGRDGAGKGSCIGRFLEHINTRHARSVALGKPTESERGQWYFQRYLAHLPTSGEMVLFDRSWYNRAGVERVMGFCSPRQVKEFLEAAPIVEGLLARDGIHVFKFYLSLGREMQLKRFHERRHDPFKRWKLSPIDIAAIEKWDAYSEAQAAMLEATHTKESPWTVIRSNDQRRSRIEAIRAVLLAIDYKGRDKRKIGEPDPAIVGSTPELLAS